MDVSTWPRRPDNAAPVDLEAMNQEPRPGWSTAARVVFWVVVFVVLLFITSALVVSHAQFTGQSIITKCAKASGPNSQDLQTCIKNGFEARGFHPVPSSGPSAMP